MAHIQGSASEIHELARYEVRQEALEECLAAIQEIHGESAAVKTFAGILYPNCLAPVEFIEYRQVDANAVFRRL